MSSNLLKLNSNKQSLWLWVPRHCSERVEVFSLMWMATPSAHPLKSGLHPLILVPHQIHHQICFLPPQKHFQTPAVTLRLCNRDPHPCLNHLLSGLLQQSPVRGAQQSPGQAPVCAELSCQGCHPHQALAAHHPQPHPTSLAPGQVPHLLQNPPHLQIHALAPQQLSELLLHHTPSRNLRSSDAGLLTNPPHQPAPFGDTAFRVAAPTLWTSLPHL